MTLPRVITLFVLLAFGTSCGYKADLYLPDQAKPAAQADETSEDKDTDEHKRKQNGSGS